MHAGRECIIFVARALQTDYSTGELSNIVRTGGILERRLNGGKLKEVRLQDSLSGYAWGGGCYSPWIGVAEQDKHLSISLVFLESSACYPFSIMGFQPPNHHIHSFFFF